MFCCAVCSIMFTGVYPEIILATPCGHVFHSECMQLCLHKSKCPFCNLHIEKKQLIKLHLQIDKNWKDTVTSLKSKANSSVINLDETLNETLKIEDDNLSPIKNNPDDSVIEVPILLSGGDMHFHRPFITTKTRKTLLTTSLSGVKLAPRVNDLVSIFSDIIPNSAVKTRLLISENKLCQLAVEEGFTNIIIINMLLANPIGLYLIDFLKNIKIKVGFSSYKCLDYEKLVFKAKTPPIVVKSFGKLNEFQESTVQFFSEICETNCKQINAEKINFECYDSHIEFTYNLAGLHFSLMSSNYNDDDSKEIYFKEIH